MDLDVKELGITFLVGAFTILGLELILHYFLNKQLTGFFQGRLGLAPEEPAAPAADAPEAGAPSGPAPGGGKKKGAESKDNDTSKDQAMRVAVFVGLAFAVGILAEDISYKYVDKVQLPFRVVPESAGLSLPGELFGYSSRFRTLVSQRERDKPWPTPDWLAIDLARSGAFELVDPDNGGKVRDWMEKKGPCQLKEEGQGGGEPCLTVKEVDATIQRLYYYAKNRVYMVDNYYDELKRIQSRLEFSRSIFMIAAIYLLFGVGLISYLRLAAFIRRQRDKQTDAPTPPATWPGVSGKRAATVLLVLLCILFFSYWAYQRESDEFHKRAFGYFSSELIAQKSKPPAPAPTAVASPTPAPTAVASPAGTPQ